MKVDKLIFLRNAIEKLDAEKHNEIFKIFKKNNIEYSENNNGIFINLTEVNDTIIDEVETYIKYIEKQEKYISENETQKEEYAKLL